MIVSCKYIRVLFTVAFTVAFAVAFVFVVVLRMSKSDIFLHRLNTIGDLNNDSRKPKITPDEAVTMFMDGCQDGIDGCLHYLRYEFPKELQESINRTECLLAISGYLIHNGYNEGRDRASGKMFAFAGMLPQRHNCDTCMCKVIDGKLNHNVPAEKQFCNIEDCTEIYIYP